MVAFQSFVFIVKIFTITIGHVQKKTLAPQMFLAGSIFAFGFSPPDLVFDLLFRRWKGAGDYSSSLTRMKNNNCIRTKRKGVKTTAGQPSEHKN